MGGLKTVVVPHSAETPLAEHLTALGVEVERTNMELGDVMLEAAGKKLYIERKSWMDWAASIQDGRYKEQKARFVGSAEENEFLVYLVEGALVPMDGATRNMSNRALTAAILKTQLRDNHHVIRSIDTRMSALILQYLGNALQKGELAPQPSKLSGMAGSAKKRKRDNLDDPSALRLEVLSKVPGMSVEKARALTERWPTLRALASAPETEIANTLCKGRRIGKVVAQRLAAL